MQDGARLTMKLFYLDLFTTGTIRSFIILAEETTSNSVLPLEPLGGMYSILKTFTRQTKPLLKLTFTIETEIIGTTKLVQISIIFRDTNTYS